MSIMAISALFALPSRAEYADLGYRHGLELKSVIRAKGPLFIQAEKYQLGESIGAGLGYNSANLSVILSANQLSEEEKTLNTELDVYYYDTSFSYSVGVRYDENKHVDFNASIGYALTEKLSLITKYDTKGVFLGLRVWLR